MDAEIKKETDDGFGLLITDNNGVEHKIGVCYDGEFDGHLQDGYPNKAAERSAEDNAYGNQARRFARWYVYRERGYDTLDPSDNPDSILATLIALARLDKSEFTDHFGDIHRQIESHYDGSDVDLPFDDADPDDVIVYRKDIYITPDPTEFDPPVLEQYLGRFEGDSDSPAMPSKDTLDRETFDALDFEVEAVSGMHYLHTDGLGTEQTKRGDDPLNREPDATIELVPFDPDEIDSFHHYVVSHLANQIRDCFLRMGLKPPVAFRQTGWGKYRSFHEQKFCPQYENYWNATETIQSWQPQ